MGKNSTTTKKGKHKVAPIPESAALDSAPPPPPSPPPPLIVSSPPAAHHIPYPPAPVDTIEEQQEFDGHSDGLGEGVEEESWQDVGHHSADDWAATAPPENSNGDIGDSDDWGTAAPQALMAPSPLQPLQRQPAGGRDRTKSYYSRQRPQLTLPNQGFGANAAGAHKSSTNDWGGYANPQQHQDTWIPENDEWEEDDGWDDQGDRNSENNGWGTNGGWGDANSGGVQQHHSATWNHAVSGHSATFRPTPHVPTSGWQSWGEEARRLPKVTFDPIIPPSPSSTGNKSVLSQQQRSQILNTLLNNPQQNQQPYSMPPNTGATFTSVATNNWQKQPSSRPHQSHMQHYRDESKRAKPPRQDQMTQPQYQSKSGGRRKEEVHDVWGLGDGWSDLHDEEDQEDAVPDAWGRRVRFSPSAVRASMLPSSTPSVPPSAVVENFVVNALPQNKLGLSTIPMSKTLSYAYSGATPSNESEPGRAAMQRITDIRFVESRGEGLKGVERAFDGKQRKASERFHWSFSPEKDERVSTLLSWIDSMSFGIASFGLQKFLQTRERGALIVNAAYRPVHSPSEPAFDWITWTQIQQTMDKILQESVGYYDPAKHTIVFVFLPSHSGNSVAIWRRKLLIPDHIRLAYQAQITQAMGSLRKEYPVLVYKLPGPPKPPPPAKKKRKWYKLWLFS